jgi:probable LLM family oxidoreductase
MELGVYSFGDIHPDPVTGAKTSPEQQLANTIERIRLADQVGLDFFGLGEHHRPDYAISAPATVLAAATTVTERIRLSSAVTVLSTEDPVRVYQQYATIDLLSHGRAELMAGRGSFIESFPLFGARLDDYDALYEEKLGLLLAIDAEERVSWSGRFRPALDDALILPRPAGGHLDIWIATGGHPGSSARAGTLGLPINYAIIGGQPSRFVPLVELYRAAGAEAGHAPERLRVAVSVPGFVAEKDAKGTFFPYWNAVMRRIAEERGFPLPNRLSYDTQVSRSGAILAGSPNEVADRMLTLRALLGLDRIGLQLDWASVPHPLVMRAIELLGTAVKPQLDRE